jgi:acyl-CoA synthetase (AMP-forming)/AMP-acid ligase II
MIVVRPDPARAQRHLADGHWMPAGSPTGLPHTVRAHAKATPHKKLTIDRLGAVTYAELEERVARAAAGLARLGVAEGDAVLVQLPNWHEALVMHLAVESLGAATVPVPAIYRARDVRHIANLTEAKVAVIPSFGSFDFLAMYRELLPEIPTLESLVLVCGDGAVSAAESALSYASLLEGQRFELKQLEAAACDPDRATQVGFTSGSTGLPKGAVHTSNTLCAEHRAWFAAFRLTSRDVILVLATVGHQIGFTMMRAAALAGATIVFLEKWEPDAAMDLIEREGVTFTFTTPAFLYDVLASSKLKGTRLPSLETWVLAGQVVTSTLRAEATAKLPHVRFAPLFGMTEMGCVVMCDAEAPDAKLPATGRAQLGVEIDVIGPDGQSVDVGSEGELVVRGPSLLLGYHKQPDATAASYTKDGYFKTGDRVRRDADGFVSITGRIKDLIKRGGESVSPEEVEDTVARHPKVLEASVVGAPDERLGERVCVFVVPRPGETALTLAELVGFLGGTGLTKQKWPERLEIVSDLPRTSIGKVDKASLRGRLTEK